MSNLTSPSQARSSQYSRPPIDLKKQVSESNPTDKSQNGLLYTVFQQLRSASEGGVVVALTSANSGEGVTHSIIALVNTLSKDKNVRILRLDARHLTEINCPPVGIAQHCQQVDANLYEFIGANSQRASVEKTSSWAGDWEYRRDCMAELRNCFDYVLIDSPALSSSAEVLSLAPIVDGVIMVIEADKTRVDQIQQAEKSIDFARGKLIGHIFNKRSFSIPNWLYKRL